MVQQEEVLLPRHAGKVLGHQPQRGPQQELVVVGASQGVHSQAVVHREVLKQKPSAGVSEMEKRMSQKINLKIEISRLVDASTPVKLKA